jgi:hypothetical protein
MCLSWKEYREMGGSLERAAFRRAEYEARSCVDAATFGRLRQDGAPHEAVKMLVFELVERRLLGSLTGEDMTGASNDGLSATYEGGQEKRAAARRLIREYLSEETGAAGTPLLYVGNA